MKSFESLSSRAKLLPVDDVDTDQIIPARFLTTTARAGLGRHLFADWSFDGEGAEVLVAGRNFGCGSSREHAAWALLDHGFRAVIATSFGDIFRTNALKNGLLPVALSDDHHRALLAVLAKRPGARVTVDLAAQVVECSDAGTLRCGFAIDGFARRCLVEGIDELGFLLAAEDEIAAYERGRTRDAAGVR